MQIVPMKATLTEVPFDGSEWLFEVKWDGYRIVAEKKGKEVNLFSRNNKNFNERFPQIIEDLKKIPGEFILDGEVVVFKNGKPSFEAIQDKSNSKDAVYVVFDILKQGGKLLTGLMLKERKEILTRTIKESSYVELADYIECDGIHFFEEIKRQGLEGMVAKKIDSIYEPSKRSKKWLKIKNVNEEEVLIIGFTQSQKGEPFGALLLGQYNSSQKLIYRGKVGTGFTNKEAADLRERMDKLKTEPYAVLDLPEEHKDHLIKPIIVGEIRFTEKTSVGSFRHPSFIGFREDKKPEDVMVEKVVAPPVEAPSTEETIEVEGNKIKISNPAKIFWPKSKVTKKEMIEYYLSIASYILPFLESRPQSLHRFPNGAGTKGFFQKNFNLPTPNYISTKEFYSKSNNRFTKFLICNNAASLGYMANLGCIEINPWSSTIYKPENPTWLIIDLDPEDISFDAVIETAQAADKVFKKYNIEGFPKTSGATGIHIYVPMRSEYNHETVKQLANFLASEIHKAVPEITSLERMPKKRQKKVYVDYLQNNFGATVAAPFSLRPQESPNISMPIAWEELKKGLKPEDFNIFNYKKRIEKSYKLFKPVLTKKTNIKNIIGNL